MFLQKNFTVIMCFCLFSQIICLKAWSDGKSVSQEKYNDFYRRQTMLKRAAEKREQGRLGYISSKKEEQKEFERLESAFAKKSRDVDQDKQDKIAEEWMEKQNLNNERKMNEAREKYISNRKKNYKYKIPESEEFEIE
jgi:hypothetical protein